MFADGDNGLVAKLCPTFVIPWTVACQAPLSMGFFQARILEWIAISFSTGIETRSPALHAVTYFAGGFITTREAPR